MGTVEAGKLADTLIIDGDPSTDVSHLAGVEIVIHSDGLSCAIVERLTYVRSWPKVSVKEVLNVAILNVSLVPETGHFSISG